MAPYSTPHPLMPNLDQLEKMNQDLTRMMPKEMASAVNLLAHPVAGVAAMSALGIGLANHAFGVWMGALSGAAEASQRLLLPIVDDFAARTERLSEIERSASKARAATKTLIAEAQSFAQDVTDMVAREAADTAPVVDAGAVGIERGHALLDHRGRVLVDRGEEQRLLAGEVGVGEGAADLGVAGDASDGAGPVAVAPEPLDGRGQDRPAGLLPRRPRP